MAEEQPLLEAVVNEVVAEAHVRPEELRPEERAYLEKHALKKPLGVLHMIDEGGPDDKILAVSAADPRFDEVTSLETLSPHVLSEIGHFFAVL